MSHGQEQDVAGIISSLVAQRARQLQVPTGRRLITVESSMSDDFRVNRHEVFIREGFVLEGDPIAALDQVLAAVENFDRLEHVERVRKINEVKSSVMEWMAYLERTLNHEDYEEFVASLAPPPKNMNGRAEVAYGEDMHDRGIHYDP